MIQDHDTGGQIHVVLINRSLEFPLFRNQPIYPFHVFSVFFNLVSFNIPSPSLNLYKNRKISTGDVLKEKDC